VRYSTPAKLVSSSARTDMSLLLCGRASTRDLRLEPNSPHEALLRVASMLACGRAGEICADFVRLLLLLLLRCNWPQRDASSTGSRALGGAGATAACRSPLTAERRRSHLNTSCVDHWLAGLKLQDKGQLGGQLGGFCFG